MKYLDAGMLNDKGYPFALSVVTDWYTIPREHFPY